MAVTDPEGLNPWNMNIEFHDVDTDDVSNPFDATSGGWTVSAGDIVKYHFCLFGNFVLIMFDFNNTTTTSLPAELLLNLPDDLRLEYGGWCGSGQFNSSGDSASVFFTAVLVSTHYSRIKIERAGLGDFPNVSNGLDCRGFVIGQLEFTE